jgi:hypothetical protein
MDTAPERVRPGNETFPRSRQTRSDNRLAGDFRVTLQRVAAFLPAGLAGLTDVVTAAMVRANQTGLPWQISRVSERDARDGSVSGSSRNLGAAGGTIDIAGRILHVGRIGGVVLFSDRGHRRVGTGKGRAATRYVTVAGRRIGTEQAAPIRGRLWPQLGTQLDISPAHLAVSRPSLGSA